MSSRSRGLLVNYLWPLRGRFMLLSVLLVSMTGLQLIGPQIIRVFIDTATTTTQGSTTTALLMLGLSYLGVALLNQVAGISTTYVGQDVGWRATNALRADLARHALQQDLAFHHTRTPGEFIERIDGDLTALSTFFSVFVVNVFGSLLLLCGIVTLIFITDWHAGMALLGYIAMAIIGLLLLRRFAVPAGIREREVSATFLGFLEERLAGIDDIRANGGGNYVMRRFVEMVRPWIQRSVAAWMRRSVIWSVMALIFMAGNALTLGAAAVLYFTHTISLGTAYLLYQYTLMLQRPMDVLTQQYQELQRSLASIARARELFTFQPAIRSGSSSLARRDGPAAVRFAHVTFAYQAGEAPILRDLDFALAPGEVLGLLGRTGSGKSTIGRLLFRLYDATQGTILLDGVDLRDLAIEDLRRRIGIVTQEVQLFHGTIRDNLTFFDTTIPETRIHAAIDALGLDSWLAQLPQGLATMLGSGGGGLSAGEAQLLAFVRVFLRDPGLVILDEPTARLDPATEALIERGLATLLRDRTAIIIAHRLGTVQRADTILIIDEGEQQEYGPRAALADDPRSRFATLMRLGRAEEVPV